MAGPDVPREEAKAALSARSELGEEFEPAVVEAFVERVGKEIDARVDARLAERERTRPARAAGPPSILLPLGSLGLGIGMTGAANGMGQPEGLIVAVIGWIAIAVVNVAYALRR